MIAEATYRDANDPSQHNIGMANTNDTEQNADSAEERKDAEQQLDPSGVYHPGLGVAAHGSETIVLARGNPLYVISQSKVG